jgi:hypothetical protein
MDVIIWLGVCALVALAVWLAAPFHNDDLMPELWRRNARAIRPSNGTRKITRAT